MSDITLLQRGSAREPRTAGSGSKLIMFRDECKVHSTTIKSRVFSED